MQVCGYWLHPCVTWVVGAPEPSGAYETFVATPRPLCHNVLMPEALKAACVCLSSDASVVEPCHVASYASASTVQRAKQC